MQIYNEIAGRTNGEIYIGVVGPVRTGKSTFIKKFMDNFVIPNITDENSKTRSIDELPQSSEGKTIMTTEPKFIPNEAVEVGLGDNAKFKVRLVDCVGYVIPEATGYIEAGTPRMVNTPWSDEPMEFEKAAALGTKKVITEHSSIGVVVTTDGSITGIPRDAYEGAEQEVINELKAINKPFVVILNTVSPKSEKTIVLKKELEAKHGVPVIATSCEKLGKEEITEILEKVLYEFPISLLTVNMPSWFYSLDKEHPLLDNLCSHTKQVVENISKIKEVKNILDTLKENENVVNAVIGSIDLAKGEVEIDLTLVDGLFYKVLTELTGVEVNDEKSLLGIFNDYTKIKTEYKKIEVALEAVKNKGYGIVSPGIDELTLEEPEIIKQGSRYGVRLRASAPSIHMIRADIQTEVAPVVGTEKQSEDLVEYLLQGFEDDKTKIWDSEIFGKSLNSLVNEGLHSKLAHMPDDAQFKLQETLTKIINEGSGGLICIIL